MPLRKVRKKHFSKVVTKSSQLLPKFMKLKLENTNLQLALFISKAYLVYADKYMQIRLYPYIYLFDSQQANTARPIPMVFCY